MENGVLTINVPEFTPLEPEFVVFHPSPITFVCRGWGAVFGALVPPFFVRRRIVPRI